MGRYFVALNGSWTRIVYVIAEVVREPNDDGYDRDLSIAANVAGSRAIIVTEEELRALPGGRVAMEHWRSGNDNSFVLDTLAQDSDMASLQEELDPRPAWTLEEAHRVVARSRQRSREMLDDSAAAREA